MNSYFRHYFWDSRYNYICKKMKMKYTLLFIVGLILMSCGTRVPYTTSIRDEFGLDSEAAIKEVQFFTSATIILERSKESGNQGTKDGALVTNSSKEQERVVIPLGTKCVFDSYTEDGGVVVRFEVGVGKILIFKLREGQTSGKFFLDANWKSGKGGELEYGNQTYYATSSSGTAYLQVVLKKLQRTKRKDRVVRGMKI